MRRRGSRENNEGGGKGRGKGEGGGGGGGNRPLARRPSRLVEETGIYAGMHSVMVREALRAGPTLYAGGPGAVANAALAPPGGDGGAAARLVEPVHIGLPTETMVLQAPVRIAEFNTLIQKALDVVVVPVIISLHSGAINRAAVNELFQLTDECITPPLRNFINQLSSRTTAARIIIDTQYYEQYLQRLRDTTHGAHRQAVIDQLQAEYSRQLPVLPAAVAQEPSFFQRTWAYIIRRPPPAAQQSIAQMFPPGGAYGGIAQAPPGVAAPVVGAAAAPVVGAPVGPMAPAGVAAAPAAAGVAGAVAAYIPNDRDVARRSKMLEQRLRKNYKDAAEFVRNYRIPGQEGAVERSPIIIKSMFSNILTVFVNLTESLIKTIAYRLRRKGVLNRADSTEAAQKDSLRGSNEVEIMLSSVGRFNFLSRDQIDSLLEQLILIMVNYINISPRFGELIPIVSQIYTLATIYTSIADLDEVRPNSQLLTDVFSDHLMDLVSNIHIRAHNSMKKYVVNDDPWVSTDGLLGKLGRLSGTLMKFVSEDRRVQVRRTVDEAQRIVVSRHEQTRMDVARETVSVLCDIASPVWTAMDKLLELVDPTEFNQTIEAADGTRTRVRGSLHVGAEQALEIGEEIASEAGQVMTRLNHGLVRKLVAVGATGPAQTLLNALVSLDDQSAAIVVAEVADQGSYQQMRASLIATHSDVTRTEMAALEPTPVSGMRGMNAAMNRGWSVASEWGRYADFETFMQAFQDYSQRATTDPQYIQFQRYINSGEIQGHLDNFTYEQLVEIYGIMDYEPDDDWRQGYSKLFDLVDATMSQPRFTENYNENGEYNNNYVPNENRNSRNGNNNYGNNNNVNNYEPEIFEGYYGWDDLTADLYSMVDYYDLSTVTTTATYRNWLDYVDGGFEHNLLPTFSHEQLTELLRRLQNSRMTNDPLVKRIKDKIISEQAVREAGNNGSQQSRQTNNTEGYNMNNNYAAQGSHAALAAAQGYSGQYSMGEPAMRRMHGMEESLQRLNTSSNYGQFYDTLLWFDEEDNGSRQFEAFQQYIQTRLPQIILTFSDAQIERIYNIMHESGTDDGRYENLARVIGRERGRRGQPVTGRVNFNALARQGSRISRSSSGSKGSKSSTNSASTFSSLNSGERRHWNMFPNNVENALSRDPTINPMESYSAAKYKSKQKKVSRKGKAKASKRSSKKGNGRSTFGGAKLTRGKITTDKLTRGKKHASKRHTAKR